MNIIKIDRSVCYHCSLAIKTKPVINNVNNEERYFCCLGCSIANQLVSFSSDNLDLKLEQIVKNKINTSINNKQNNFNITNRKTFYIKGVTCVSCAPIIEKILSLESGVVSSKVNLISERVKIAYDKDYFDLNKVVKDLKKFGYTLVIKNSSEDSEYLSENYLLRIGLVWFLSMDIMALSLGFYYGQLENYPDIISWVIYIEAFLATLIIFGLGFPFLKSAFVKALNKQLSMESLVSFGTLTAYFYSTWAMLKGRTDVYYDTASMIIALVLLGKFLENSSKSKASQTIKKLLNLGAKTATIIKNNQEEQIEIEDVQV
ncbi:MAG: heavy metal translocating P-type ATPase metal-binding domain-containing protein, partial [Candidatus Sericytochromatia bacterium]|nr:heavy metal translocating P-type ATPase metal-binding domain-containing protein [Candidatus Sericytochromatia bacterium]